MVVAKEDRLCEFLRRLAAVPAANDFDSARLLLAATLNSVEDELSGVPFAPEHWQTDGRMYPPQDDSRRDVPGIPNVKRFRSRAHNTYIGMNGAIEIRTIGGEVLLSKAGVDGRTVWEQ
jgi:hypothetical protein